MTFKEMMVIRILFTIAKFFCTDEKLSKEIDELQQHVRLYGKDAKDK
jgi:hypothetical protein